eukprot:760652-Hanusia_phi.AAC.8
MNQVCESRKPSVSDQTFPDIGEAIFGDMAGGRGGEGMAEERKRRVQRQSSMPSSFQLLRSVALLGALSGTGSLCCFFVLSWCCRNEKLIGFY